MRRRTFIHRSPSTKAANLSPRQFSRTLRAETGQSPAKAIGNLRIETAKGMVEQSRHPLEVVALLTGFVDPNRMCRPFLRACGQPPQVIRRSVRLETLERRDEAEKRQMPKLSRLTVKRALRPGQGTPTLDDFERLTLVRLYRFIKGFAHPSSLC